MPGVAGNRYKRGTKGIKGNPGHLIIGFYLIKSKTNSSQIFHIRDNFVVELKAINTKIEANLKSGEIQLKQIGYRVDDLEIESLLASVFSIAILHVMLQPRQGVDKKVGDKYVKSVNTTHYRMLNSTIVNTDMLLAYNLAFSVGFDGCDNNGFAGDGGGCGGCGG